MGVAYTDDFTPNGKALSKCSIKELNETIQNIKSDAMLRMHAMGRLLDEIDHVADKKGWCVITDESGFTDKIVTKKEYDQFQKQKKLQKEKENTIVGEVKSLLISAGFILESHGEFRGMNFAKDGVKILVRN